MSLRSKSVQEYTHSDDGIRVCIMRKPDENKYWDIWMPTLAPPLLLHKAYQSGRVDWAAYIQWFNKEVIKGYHQHIKLLAQMAKNNTITVLCWEKTPEQCHRRLIVEEVLRIDKTLETVLR